jgi:hypothetical protein
VDIPGPDRKMELAEGTWCTECERFEVEDYAPDRCLACGCPPEAHVEALVVEA